MKKRPSVSESSACRKADLSAVAQQRRVLTYLQTHDTGINRYQAERLLGVCQLATRIFELKERGYRFLTVTERAADPHGVEHEGIARYFLQRAGGGV